MIVVGAVYAYDCPQGKFIPGWLIIGGFIWLIHPLLRLSTLVRRTAEEQRLERQRQQHTRNIVNAFMIGWFLIGSYFVFRIGRPNFEPPPVPGGSLEWCAPPLWLFAHWLLIAGWALVALALAAAVLALAVTLSVSFGLCLLAAQRDDDEQGADGRREVDLV